MRDELLALAKLSAMDASTRARDEELMEIPKRLEKMEEDVARLGSFLEQERLQVEDATSLQQEQEHLLEDNYAGIERAKMKVAQSQNMKEADAARRELEANKRSSKEREGELGKIKAAIEAKRASMAERESQFAEVQQMLEEERGQAEQRKTEIEADKAELLKDRDEWLNKLSRETRKHYERLQKRYLDPVVVTNAETCPACRMTFPPQLYIEMQKFVKLCECRHCKRIVVYSDVEATDVEVAAPAEEGV